MWYWRDYDNNEVDYILEKNGKLIAVKVKSNDESTNSGLSKFKEKFHPILSFVVGEGGMSVETFLSNNPSELF